MYSMCTVSYSDLRLSLRHLLDQSLDLGGCLTYGLLAKRLE
jgi:hypothetical protein